MTVQKWWWGVSWCQWVQVGFDVIIISPLCLLAIYQSWKTQIVQSFNIRYQWQFWISLVALHHTDFKLCIIWYIYIYIYILNSMGTNISYSVINDVLSRVAFLTSAVYTWSFSWLSANTIPRSFLLFTCCYGFIIKLIDKIRIRSAKVHRLTLGGVKGNLPPVWHSFKIAQIWLKEMPIIKVSS